MRVITKPKTKTKIRSYVVNLSDYKIISEIKRGGFGIVYLVENNHTHERLAAKVNLQSGNPVDDDKFISREIGILIRVQAPTIIRFSGFSLNDFDNNPNVTFFMDYKEKGSLQKLLDLEWQGMAPHDFDNTAKQIILCGIAHGMMVLHSRRVIHRDLKPDNVLLDSEYRPFITDFGLSKFIDPENSKSQSMASCGTQPYIAPEVFDSNHYGPKVDVYSFGILMFEIVTGERAYADDLKKKGMNFFSFGKLVIEGKRPKFTTPVKPALQALIERCWSKEPKDRPTFRELFNKLSLSLEDDDYTIESRLKDMVSYAYEDEDEDFDYYRYCLENVEPERVYDYVDEITTAQPSKESSRDVKGSVPKSEFDAVNRQNQQRIEELVEQNQKFQREIEELKKKHENEIKLLSGKNAENQREIGELKRKNEKQAAEIDNLMGQVTINIPAFNDVVSNRIKVLEASIQLINAKLEQFESQHPPSKTKPPKSKSDSITHKETKAKPTLFGTRPKSSVPPPPPPSAKRPPPAPPPPPPPPPPGYKLKTKSRTYR